MKKILYLVLVAVLAAAVPAWGQNNQTYTLGKIPAGWTVKANGNTVTVTDSTAIIPAGATVVLTPTNTAKVKKVTLVDATPTTSCRLIDLSQITADSVIQDCDTLTGTLAANVKISIANGATVILDGVTINGTNNGSYKWAGITCEGNATLILKDDTTNTVKGFYDEYPGIYVPVGSTLTIQGETSGTGKLIAGSNGYGAGIGGGYHIPCGNIRIEDGIIEATGGDTGGAGIGSGVGSSCDTITISGGNVTATGGSNAAGIGSAWSTTGDVSSCGAITISGGTVNATSGTRASGIGSGKGSSCGAITITSDVTRVTATSDAAVSIGYGNGGIENSSCGTITFGTQQMYNGTTWTTTPTSGEIYGGLKLTISTDPNIVIIDTWDLTPSN